MDPRSLFEPHLGAFLAYCVGFCFRYFLIAGGLVLLLHVRFRQRLLPYRIQQRFPTARLMRHEIVWSMSNTVCTGLFTMLLYYMVHQDHTRMYFEIGELGWGWWVASILIGIAGFDTWFYWQHRLLHTRWLFKHAHSVHHRVNNPTALAAFAHHPVETFFEDAYFLVLVLVVPVHPLALAAIGLHAFTLGILGHLGYEFFPRGFTRHWLLGWHNTGTHHNLHHSRVDCNYGLYFNVWDRIMGTNHPEYHARFDEVTAQRGSARLPAEPEQAR